MTVESLAGTQHYTFAMDTAPTPSADNNVRQALKYAVNREELVDKILFGYGSVGNDHPIGENQRFYNSELEQKTYDPDKAKWYLKQAGIDSVSVALHSSDAAFSGAVDAATLFQNSAKEAGIDLKVVREPKDGYWSDVWMKDPFTAVYWGAARSRTRCSRPPTSAARPGTTASGATSASTSCWSRRVPSSTRTSAARCTGKCRISLPTRAASVIPMFANYVQAIGPEVAHGEMASNWEMDGERWMERWWMA